MTIQLNQRRIVSKLAPAAIAAFGILVTWSGIHAQSTDHAVTVYTGYFSYGVEVSSFVPCGSDLDLWVSEETSFYDTLVSNYLEMTTEPYEQVLLQVEGQRQGAADGGGFANEYDDVLVVTGIIEMRPATENDCQ